MKKNVILVGLLAAALTSCGGDVKDKLGMRKPAPDEFLVISNPPLSVPPSFDLVEPGSEPIAQQVEEKDNANEDLDKSDKALLKELSAGSGKSDAKTLVDKDYYEAKRDKRSKGAISSTISKLQGDGNKVIDPVAERDRLKANAAEGKPVNEGEVKNKSESTISRLLD